MFADVEELQSALHELRQRRGDSAHIEVKRAAQGLPRNLGTTISAFANMPGGGTIILGVDEKSGFSITGVDNAAKLEQGIASLTRNAIDPSPKLNFETFKVSKSEVLVVEVIPLPLQNRPAYYQGKAYLRQSDGDYRMQDYELKLIAAEKSLSLAPRRFDEQELVNLGFGELDPLLVEQYLELARESSTRLRPLDDESILKNTAVITDKGHPTLAGLYALGQYPQGTFPSLGVTIASQIPERGDGSRVKALRHLDGPIPVLLEGIMDWCESHVPTVVAYQESGHMQDRHEIPLPAIRELAANALVHRDLSPNTLEHGKSIQIRLTSRGMFFLSPGGLKGVSAEQLQSEDHVQAAVNQRLYAICRNLQTDDGNRIIEGEGGGIGHVFRLAEASSLPRPSLVDSSVEFRATLWSPVDRKSEAAESTRAAVGESRAPLASRKPKEPQEADSAWESKDLSEVGRNVPLIVKALREGTADPMTVADVMEHTGLSRGQTNYALRQALDAGIVLMSGGQGQHTTAYRLSDV